MNVQMRRCADELMLLWRWLDGRKGRGGEMLRGKFETGESLCEKGARLERDWRHIGDTLETKRKSSRICCKKLGFERLNKVSFQPEILEF